MTHVDYWLLDFKHNWRVFLSKKSNMVEMAITLAFFYIISYMFKINLVWLEGIKGVQLLHKMFLFIYLWYYIGWSFILIFYFWLILNSSNLHFNSILSVWV